MLTTVLMCCAFIGGAIVVVQLVTAALAMGAGHALHLHHHGGGGGGGGRVVAHRGGHHFKALPKGGARHTAQHAAASVHSHWAMSLLWGMLNFQALVAGIAVFGLSGLAATAAAFSTVLIVGIGASSAFVMMLAVAAVFSLMANMDSDNTLRIEDAVGAMGTVYLSIPANNEGQGKVTVTLQQRLVEFAAVTKQERALAAGDKIMVINVVGPSVMEVISAEKYLPEAPA